MRCTARPKDVARVLRVANAVVSLTTASTKQCTALASQRNTFLGSVDARLGRARDEMALGSASASLVAPLVTLDPWLASDRPSVSSGMRALSGLEAMVSRLRRCSFKQDNAVVTLTIAVVTLRIAVVRLRIALHCLVSAWHIETIERGARGGRASGLEIERVAPPSQ